MLQQSFSHDLEARALQRVAGEMDTAKLPFLIGAENPVLLVMRLTGAGKENPLRLFAYHYTHH